MPTTTGMRKTAAEAELTATQKLDPVEWVKFYWEQNSDDDLNPFPAMSSVLRLDALMTSALEAELTEFTLAPSGYLMLKTLEWSDDDARLLSRVARHLLVNPTTVRLIAGRLEKHGLLKREPHPSDRRATTVAITPRGRKSTAEATYALEQVDYGLPGPIAATAKQLVSSLPLARRQDGNVDRAHGDNG